MSGVVFLWFLGATVVTLATWPAAVIRHLDLFHGSWLAEPTGVSAKVQGFLRMWLLYGAAMLLIPMTGGGFAAAGTVFDIFDRFSLEACKYAVEELLALRLPLTLWGGLAVAVVWTSGARILALTYSGFLVRSLVVVLVVPFVLPLIAAPFVMELLGGHYKALSTCVSDYIIRDRFVDGPLAVAAAAFVTASLTEGLVYWGPFWLGGRRPARLLLERLAVGESALYSLRDVEQLYISTLYYWGVVATTNGGPPALTVRWASFYGSEAISWAIWAALRAGLGWHERGIAPALQWKYDMVRLEELRGVTSGAVKSYGSYDAARQAIVEEITRNHAAQRGRQLTTDEMRLWTDELLEVRARTQMRQSVHVITTRAGKKRSAQILEDANYREVEPGSSFGNRRFLIVNDASLLLAAPVPYHPERGHVANMAVLVEGYPFRIDEYSGIFDRWWRRL